jgi:hypothetical protein
MRRSAEKHGWSGEQELDDVTGAAVSEAAAAAPEPEPELDICEWTLKNPVRVNYVEEARSGLSFEKRRVIDPETEDVIGELGEARFADLRQLIERNDDLDEEFEATVLFTTPWHYAMINIRT